MPVFNSKQITDKQAEQLVLAQKLAHKNRKAPEYYCLCNGLGHMGEPIYDMFLYQMGMLDNSLRENPQTRGRISKNILMNLRDIMLVALPDVNPKYPATDMNTRLTLLKELGYGVKQGYEMLPTDAKYSYFRAVQKDIEQQFNALKPEQRQKQAEKQKRREINERILARIVSPMH